MHLIHHSHDDVGWLKTYQEYYDESVNQIISNSISELLVNPSRRFSYAEMKYFSMWWSEQPESVKADVRKLVAEGRLELLSGGWTQHDEACPTYEQMITNMVAGHEFIKKEFGIAPRVGWQIDPFGHSNANALLFSQMGFDALIFARAHLLEKQERKR